MIRLSGAASLEIADRIFRPTGGKRPSDCASHTVHHGYIAEPGAGEVADEALVTVMRSPRTFTTEDTVEITCHGGVATTRKVLQLCLGQGARLAEPGEFTKRAFLSGRIDLSQAEAVLDVVRSRTDAFRRIAVDQLRGVFSEEVRKLRGAVIDILAAIELSIDFTEEDVDFSGPEKVIALTRSAASSLGHILETSDRGIIMRCGASVVICGRPNVGKSSLMNALLRHDRVIVTPVAGTTRDIVEESINIAGVRVRLSDTAGMIETDDRVEMEGIRRSKEKLQSADAVIFMIDSSQDLSEKDIEIHRTLEGKDIVVAANKTDLPRRLDIKRAEERFGAPIMEISALERTGLEGIEDALALKLLKGDPAPPEGPVVTSLRHKELLERASRCLERAMETAQENYNGELVASDLNEAVHYLGLIIGESVEDGVLDRIFSEFCIGK